MKTRTLAFLHGSGTPVCAARVNKYFVDYYTLQFMTEGGLELFYDEARWVLEGAWFWPAYPGPHTRFHSAPGYDSWNHRFIAFTGPLANQWRAEGLYPTVPQTCPDPVTSVALFDELLSESKQPGRWHQLKAINILERILIDLAESRHEQKSREPWLENILSDLESSTSFTPDYDRLAGRVNMSLSSLRRKFRQATGIPIHQYVLQIRMARARERLGETDLPMKAIAEELGYLDVYFFTRQFKKETGSTPGAFRKSRQG